MNYFRLDSTRPLRRRPPGDHQAAWPLPLQGARRERQDFPRSHHQADRTLTYKLNGRRSAQGARLEALYDRHAALQPGWDAVHLRHPAFAGSTAISALFNPQKLAARSASTWHSTPRRASPRTRTGRAMAANRRWRTLSQMVALAFHNWVSAAIGIAIAAALVRGIARHTANTIGNFWVDLTRITYYLLLPICLIYCDLPCVAGHDPELQTL